MARLVDSETAARGDIVEWSQPLIVPSSVQLLVHATPVGMSPHEDAQIAIDWDSMQSGAVVADVVPKPAMTTLLRAAGAAGATIIDGRGMLVNQAAQNIRLWAGVDPDTAVMRAALDEALERT